MLLHAVFAAAPVLVSVISFAIFVLSGNRLSVSIAFTVSRVRLFSGRDVDGVTERRLHYLI